LHIDFRPDYTPPASANFAAVKSGFSVMGENRADMNRLLNRLDKSEVAGAADDKVQASRALRRPKLGYVDRHIYHLPHRRQENIPRFSWLS
jgi:hypothetical protein